MISAVRWKSSLRITGLRIVQYTDERQLCGYRSAPYPQKQRFGSKTAP